jgi:hypothetical protein
LINKDNSNQASVPADMTTELNNFNQNTEEESTSKYKHQIIQIMSTAHNNLQTIEKTSQEVQSLLINLRKKKRRSKTCKRETESQSQAPICKELPIQPKKIRTLNVIINNVAGVDKRQRKLEIIVHNMRDQNIDIFLGKEINIQPRDTSFSSFLRKKEIRDAHFATSESSCRFHSYKKPGSIFCITGSNLKPHVKQKLTDHMGRWAGCIYQLKSVNIAFLSQYTILWITHITVPPQFMHSN